MRSQGSAADRAVRAARAAPALPLDAAAVAAGVSLSTVKGKLMTLPSRGFCAEAARMAARSRKPARLRRAAADMAGCAPCVVTAFVL